MISKFNLSLIFAICKYEKSIQRSVCLCVFKEVVVSYLSSKWLYAWNVVNLYLLLLLHKCLMHVRSHRNVNIAWTENQEELMLHFKL
jgi:hypothetical protein